MLTGIEPIQLRDLCRTAATRLIRKGAPTAVAQRAMGHASLDMMRRYLVVEADDIRRWMEAPTPIPDVPKTSRGTRQRSATPKAAKQ